LKDEIRFFKVGPGEVSQRCPELLQSVPDRLSVLGSGPNPKVNVAGCTRNPVSSDGVRTDEKVFSAFGV